MDPTIDACVAFLNALEEAAGLGELVVLEEDVEAEYGVFVGVRGNGFAVVSCNESTMAVGCC